MRESLRQAMAWLHTWLGLTLGWLSFAIFLTGTLSYFKEEISHWAHPELVVRPLDTRAALDSAEAYLRQAAPGAATWYLMPPDQRQPGLEVMWAGAPGDGERLVSKLLDPTTGQEAVTRSSHGGDFFYRFHYELQLGFPWGRWLASLAAMAMLVALVSGIITHKKIFKEFFTFRPGKGQRSWLDGHNALAVLALPFHLMITYSGLVIFMAMLLPAALATVYKGEPAAFYQEVFPNAFPGPAKGEAGAPMSLASLYDRAMARWPGARLSRVEVQHPGDAGERVVFYRHGGDRIAYLPGDSLAFDGISGALLETSVPDRGALLIAGGFYGLHMGQFANAAERWLYFLFGLSGTAMIGTGLVLWVSKRQLKHAREARLPFGLRLVGVLNLASVAGLPLAVGAFFWANRILPLQLEHRDGWEVRAFFLAWLAALLHAMVRQGRRGWLEQLSLSAGLYLGLPLLGVFTTGRGLPSAIAQGDWATAGVDLTALACGLALLWLVRKVALRGALPAVASRPLKLAP